MKNIYSAVLLAYLISYSSTTQAMFSKALLTRLPSRQALTRLANTRSFSQSAYTHNQHHEQSHKIHNQARQANSRYSVLSIAASTIAVGAAAYISYDQYNEYQLQQLINKYQCKTQEDILALTQAHTLINWITLTGKSKELMKYYSYINGDFTKSVWTIDYDAYNKIKLLFERNQAVRNYFIDHAILHIDDLNDTYIYLLADNPSINIKLFHLALNKFNELKSTKDKSSKFSFFPDSTTKLKNMSATLNSLMSRLSKHYDLKTVDYETIKEIEELYIDTVKL